jgi:hypothetical protein
MPRPLPVPVRQAIWRRLQDGQDTPTIARELDLDPRTVRRLIGRLRHEGPAALSPAYGRCGTATPRPADPLVQAVRGLRRDHPTWGAGLIRVMLRRQFPDDKMPAVRTLQRWLSRADLAPASAGRRPAKDARRAGRPHQIWQMDATELVRLRSDQLVCWLRLVDECSGAVLWTAVFPPRPLVPGPGDGHPGPIAAGLRPLGAARAVPGGQRGALGLAG